MNEQSNDEESFFNYMWLVYCEIIYFILFSFILFCQYRYKKNYTKWLNIFFSFFLVCKVVLTITLLSTNDKTKKDNLNFLSSFKTQTTYIYFYNFGGICYSLWYNLIYYWIGIFFGNWNYVIQKGIDYNDIEEQKKPFLLNAVKSTKYWGIIQSRKAFTLGYILLFICLVLLFINPIWLFISIGDKSIGRSQNVDCFLINPIVNVILSFDIEFIICVIHFIGFVFFIKKDRFINKILSHPFWIISNKMYFTFILILNPVILYVLFQSETRIALNVGNSFLYSLICGFIVFVLSCIVYIFFERPGKRLMKLWLKNKDNKVKTL